ncbi:tetratricopeptide repeat protein [Bacillus sp. T3]|uniref:tetratricopeptide repeat protein n=1 Tax=Bacillus sp. T3 TaxID=467262 RepID=UPI0029816F07|nr:tetratricopeptide repeat protein [Bacillus sp. T3]
MKKRERFKKNGNIILFPDLDKRLVEKGLDQLKQKNFSAAIELLNEASQLNPDNEDVFIGLVLAYFEAGNYNEANKLAKKLLQTGIGDYFKIVDMYIMILVQQHEYAEIVMTIEALLEEKEVPPEKIEHFMNMLQFSRKVANSVQEQPEPGYYRSPSKD